jgi:crotonobetainyl-CoA:carnitine CoA-transferase CaiB-like acyl-CoA transferase
MNTTAKAARPMLKPLQGVRIADFTVHAAGPFCTHLLALLGAECIKVESSKRLDVFRKPHPVYGRMEAATFAQVAANKLSVQLNLKEPRGVELAKRVVAVSDIMCESFRPGVMERLGLGYEALKTVKSDIVMVSISACGQTGPERKYAGYAPLFGATGGLGTLTGYEDGPPVEVRHVMDHSTGLNAAAATLAALFRKKRTGLGQHVDVAAREVAASFIGDALLQFAATGKAPGRQGNDASLKSPHNVYPCAGKDSWVSIAVASEDEWRQFAITLGRSDWLENPKFADAHTRWRNREELDRVVAAWTRDRSREDVTRILQAAGVAAFPSYTTRDIADDPHLNQRGTIQSLTNPAGDTRKVVGPPWRFSRTPGKLDTWTPKLGEHNQYVFGELLGLGNDEIETLVRDKVIY